MFIEEGPQPSTAHRLLSTAAAPEQWWPSLADPRGRDVVKGRSHALVFGEPDPRLRGYVLSYTGIRNAGPDAPYAQRVPPECGVMLTVSLSGASPGRVNAAQGPAALPVVGVTGLHDSFYVVDRRATSGSTLLVALTPPGAYALFGVAMHALANTHVALSDLMGRRADRLAERLAGARTWHERFAVLDEVLVPGCTHGRTPDKSLVLAWQRIARTHGRLRIGQLVDEIGCSPRHLEKKFGEQTGLPPKTVARIWRFQRAAHLLLTAPEQSIAQVAHVCGYTDQAHLNRDFRILAGCTPTRLVGPRGPGQIRSMAATSSGLP
ncbi:helix-turn-helix domain-containing protein [Streptantibioticus rubrisoli]|uniref:Helix-turn-helix transcriptional regulator n=1 Tax=Streptantibioticus rubrisoli TaxID=1387313 RepID=A0ABT1P6N7_9ACTN|nr:helix-turn-helix transcriptional regulator [Streptantibioticus rubrisoli]MCQ4041048.1 helix-turn-helix transcriptional regulator [Streptantibioticus rubrisoli]